MNHHRRVITPLTTTLTLLAITSAGCADASEPGADDATESSSDTGDESTDDGTRPDLGDTGDPDPEPEDPRPECLSDTVLAALSLHLHNLDGTAFWLAGHASASEVTGFLHAPGLPPDGPPAMGANMIGLFEPCTDALTFDENCWEGQGFCQQIECTGGGPGWSLHHWLDGAYDVDGWHFEAIEVDSRWDDGWTGIMADMSATLTSPDGFDLSLEGEAWLGQEGFIVDHAFPQLHADGPVRMRFVDFGPEQASGEIVVGTSVLATADETGVWVSTDACQPPRAH